MKIVITGLGHVSALGLGRETLRERAPALVHKTVQTAHGPRTVAIYKAAEANLPAEIPESVKRRMPRISRMAFATSLEALEDAFGPGYAAVKSAPDRIGLIIGSAYGCYDIANDYNSKLVLAGPQGASPSLFAGSVQNALASHLSISFGIQGPSSTVLTMEHTVFAALRMAVDWLKQDFADHVLVTAGDELAEFHLYENAHWSGESVAPGEGFASFVLSRAPAARAYCEIADVQMNASAPPERAHIFSVTSDRTVSPKPANSISHADHFGRFVTAAALETAMAALTVRDSKTSTAVWQTTRFSEQLSLTLRPT